MPGVMASDYWKKIESVFHEIVERPENERESALVELCGDDASLLADVRELIEADSGAEGFMTPPSAERIGELLGRRLEEREVGRQVGNYTIRGVLGIGGMGEVFLASRTDEFEQRVAIKIIKKNLATESVLQRFRTERRALARLEHKNIARLIDGGTTDEGLPYFVMEYVDGDPLHRFCADRRLGVEARLELFLQICDAVAHAHQNLVIHRDIKPGNILVDRAGSPRLLDFGIATVLDPDRRATQDEREARMMTPDYASPEQIKGLQIGTATDVYSLGVVLYELLSGHHPYRASSTDATSLYRAVLETEPDRPSTAVDRTEELETEDGTRELITPETVGRERSEPPGSLRKHLAGDLDQIVMKTLHKDPAQRYGTVEALRRDIRRYLTGHTVAARGNAPAYRLAKFLGRHRASVAIAGLLLVSLLAMLGLYVADLREDKALLSELQMLADSERYRDLTERMATLWPVHPERADDMQAWLDEADELLARLPVHEASLARLRTQGTPLPHPKERELAELRATLELCERELDQFADAETEDERQHHTEALNWRETTAKAIAQLETELEREPHYEFDETSTTWWHEDLTQLVAGLRRFGDDEPHGETRLNIAQRHAAALAMGALSTAETEGWNRAIEAIGDVSQCPAYGGLELASQPGLIPLGQDSESGLWEFWHTASGEKPERGDDGQWVIAEGTGAVFVLLPGGETLIGAQSEDEDAPHFDPQAEANEAPLYGVDLAPFLMSKYELTKSQLREITGEGRGYYPPGLVADGKEVDWSHPAENISWNDCFELCMRMNWILPTEAQWEYAARAGTDTPWWTGRERDTLIGAVNLADRSATRGGATWAAMKDWPELDDGYPVHAPVTHYRPNAFGLHSVAGNVWEWCRDHYRRNPVLGAEERTEEGDVPRVRGQGRVVRGGGFNFIAAAARSANRGPGDPDTRVQAVGFRPAMRLSD